MISYRCTYKRQLFFWFTGKGFLKRPVLLRYWLLSPFSTRKPHAKAVPRKDYFTHLRTLKNARKGRWVISLDYRASHPRHFWAIGDDSCSKKWRPSGLTLRCRQGYVEDPAAKDFVARKAHTIALSKAQGSCHRTSNNQLYSRVWKSLGDSLPKLYCVA